MVLSLSVASIPWLVNPRRDRKLTPWLVNPQRDRKLTPWLVNPRRDTKLTPWFVNPRRDTKINHRGSIDPRRDKPGAVHPTKRYITEPGVFVLTSHRALNRLPPVDPRQRNRLILIN